MTLERLIEFINENFSEEERKRLYVMTDGRDHSYRKAAVDIADINYGNIDEAPEYCLVIN